ncbi:MAG: RNA polymerase II mediator complex subunit [Stictis urceolatum]|nr:RNA polymerase II mediator complex subunit [Stictis urceolata]
MSQPTAHEDIITSLQTSLDQLATQLYASLKYTTTHHPLSAPSALASAVIKPSSLPNPTSTPGSPLPNKTEKTEAPPASPTHRPLDQAAFEADIRELAVDLVAKQRLIEELIRKLPADVVAEERVQEGRIEELERELRGVEGEVRRVGERREEVLARVEGVVGRFRRG